MGIDTHRAEFIYVKIRAVLSCPLLPEENRSRRIEMDRYAKQNQQPRQCCRSNQCKQPVQQIFQIHLINSRFPHVFFPLFFHRLVTFPAFFFFSIAVLSVTITIFSVAITAIGAVSVACRTLRHAVQYIAADRNLRILEEFQCPLYFTVLGSSLVYDKNCRICDSAKRMHPTVLRTAAYQ